MPELPEVETIVRTLKPQVQGKEIKKVELLLERTLEAGKDYLPTLQGAIIHDVFRRGKLLIMGLNQPATESFKAHEPWLSYELLLIFHFKMTGRFFVHPPGTQALKHTRMIFDMDDGRLFFDDMRTFGYCRIMKPAELKDWPFWSTYGPEPLDTPALELAKLLKEKRTNIKATLLDQKVIAGIGNIYADEALFRARIHPEAKAHEVQLSRLEKLASAVQEVLKISIQECGSSIRDYRDAKGDAGSFQNNFLVYGRKGEKCKVCNESLETKKIAGRTSTFCPHCQY